MRMRTVLVLAFTVLVAAFVALNWGELARPASLHLGIVQMQAPLGLVMLGLFLVAWALFAIYAVSVQATALLEVRSYNKEIKAQKELLDKAETSRFTELCTMIERIETEARAHSAQTQQLLQQQLDQIRQDLIEAIEHSGNTLAAYMGELEDRIERSPDKVL